MPRRAIKGISLSTGGGNEEDANMFITISINGTRLVIDGGLSVNAR